MANEKKAREYSEQRILAIPADVNEDGKVFYLDSDLGTADDEHNGLSGEIEMAYLNGIGAEGLRVKEYLERKRKNVQKGYMESNDEDDDYLCGKLDCVCEIINILFGEE